MFGPNVPIMTEPTNICAVGQALAGGKALGARVWEGATVMQLPIIRGPSYSEA
jgi:hypothetical protein